MHRILLTAICTIVVGANSAALGQSIDKAPDGSITWQAGVDGATLEFNPDGSWKRIYSKYTQDVTIDDKRGVRTAMVIAEEKAKANIVRYLNQHVSTSRAIGELQNTISSKTQEGGTAGDKVTSIDQRAITDSVTELTGSIASGSLSGVVVIENGYDKEKKEAWVAVGLSRKSMAAARATQDALSETQRPATVAPPATAGTPSQPEHAGSILRRGNSDF